MPPLKPGYVPTSIPDVDESTNFLSIAFRKGRYTPISEFTPAQKIATFDFLVARGFQSLAQPVKSLRRKAHPSYIRNKDEREINQSYSNIFCLGSVRYIQFIPYEQAS